MESHLPLNVAQPLTDYKSDVAGVYKEELSRQSAGKDLLRWRLSAPLACSSMERASVAHAACASAKSLHIITGRNRLMCCLQNKTWPLPEGPGEAGLGSVGSPGRQTGAMKSRGDSRSRKHWSRRVGGEVVQLVCRHLKFS